MKRLVFLLVAVATSAFAQSYSVTPIPGLDSWAHFPRALDNDGTIAGTMVGPVLYSQMFIIENGVLTTVPPVGFYDYFGGMNVFHVLAGTAISDHFLLGFWYDGANHTIPMPAGTSWGAASISDDGRIVGWSDAASGQRRAVSLDNGVLVDLGWGDGSYARQVNTRGQIAGYITLGGALVPVLYANGGFTTIPGRSDSLTVINKLSENGTVAGSFSTPTGRHIGFVFSNTGLVTMSSMGEFSEIEDANSLGEAVGWFGNLAERRHALVYRNGRAQELELLLDPAAEAIDLTAAVAINDLGQIVAIGTATWSDEFFNRHVYLLSPQWTPAERLARLEALVHVLPSERGFDPAASSRLASVARSLQKGNTSGACSSLRAFERDLEVALKSRKIKAGAARRLATVVSDLERALGTCG
jgi:probable HAF family extracellular repeat protein